MIGLYLNPPQHAAVFCVDEKTAIQALDRLDPYCRSAPADSNDTALSITGTWARTCQAEKQLEALSEQTPVVERLRSLPGIGLIDLDRSRRLRG